MSFTHVALFVWNDDVDVEALGGRLRTALEEYVASVSGVENYLCGTDAGFTSGSADFAVVGQFTSADTFVTYRDDPRHQEILGVLIAPNLASRWVVQVEG